MNVSRDQYLSGQALNRRTGTAVQSVTSFTKPISSNSFQFGSNLNYLDFWERGIRAHWIRPVTANALRFKLGGRTLFAKKVFIPTQPARPWARPTWDDIQPYVRDTAEKRGVEGAPDWLTQSDDRDPMNFVSAFISVRDALNEISSLPNCIMTPRAPENTGSFPALYLSWEQKKYEPEGGTLEWSVPQDSRATLTAWVYCKSVNPTKGLEVELAEYVQLIEDKMKALTESTPDFRCRVTEVNAIYGENASYGAALITILLGAFN